MRRTVFPLLAIAIGAALAVYAAEISLRPSGRLTADFIVRMLRG